VRYYLEQRDPEFEPKMAEILGSREFIEFLKLLDAAYPADTAIEVILDNHSVHVSRETTSWLAAQPIGRFAFTFTPTHGSWLNLIEGFFSKLARSMLRHIRVYSKHELSERLMAFIGDIVREPLVHFTNDKKDGVPTWPIASSGNDTESCGIRLTSQQSLAKPRPFRRWS
jgi:transposase